MSDPRIASFQSSSQGVLQHLHSGCSKLQTGRATSALIENIAVDAYGQKQTLKSLAGISIPEPRTIMVQPWDRSIMGNIEKALQTANLGTSPVNDGVTIRLALPPMTQERREQMRKIVHQLAEEARISLRKHRQEAHDAIRQEKDEDVKETLMEELQKAVDDANAKIAESGRKKEEEIMRV